MEKDFNTAFRKGLESDRIKLTRRRKQLLWEMGCSEDLDSAEITEKLHEQTLANDVMNRSLTNKAEEIDRLKDRIAELETGKNSWLWAFQNAVATYLAFDKRMGHGVINGSFAKGQTVLKVLDRQYQWV